VHFSIANLFRPLDETFVTYLPTVQPLKTKLIENKKRYFMLLTSSLIKNNLLRVDYKRAVNLLQSSQTVVFHSLSGYL